MRILITGGDGQLGKECVSLLGGSHEITAVGRKRVDISKYPAVEQMIHAVAPQVIINCAAFTHVDASESEKNAAWRTNVKGPRNLARCAEKIGSKLVYISSDYVFNGKKKYPQPYTECDHPDPVSYYGKTKFEGEKAVQAVLENHIVLRTSWMYGITGRNFLKTILELSLGRSDKIIRVVNDQFGSPTWAYRLARQIAVLIEVDARGTYHASSEGYCSWHELAVYFLKKMGVTRGVVPCKTAEFPLPAQRPVNSILENERLKQKGMNRMPHWTDDVAQFAACFRDQLMGEAKRMRN
jgi:dTDP-4-dehydrorhamnose reductase